MQVVYAIFLCRENLGISFFGLFLTEFRVTPVCLTNRHGFIRLAETRRYAILVVVRSRIAIQLKLVMTAPQLLDFMFSVYLKPRL